MSTFDPMGAALMRRILALLLEDPHPVAKKRKRNVAQQTLIAIAVLQVRRI